MTFRAAFQGQLILLDLFSETIPQYSRFESFYGHYYIWNMLHDFGGNNFLFGSLVNVTNVSELGINHSDIRGLVSGPIGSTETVR
jgi:alpha-N-acetylglucosaminidase